MAARTTTHTTLLLGIFLATTALKLLLIPSYRSTDFEVHRNWLALTRSLPLRDWYFEATSEWTLDYPPFFAYFECALSQVAATLARDAKMLEISQEPYVSEATVLFQRLSVMATDVVLLGGLALWVRSLPSTTILTTSQQQRRVAALSLLVLGNVGLLMVDHMHFQYNGMLLGLLLLSLAAFRHHHVLLGAACFAALLMFKHLFLFLAPAYFTYLLSSHCFQGRAFLPLRFLALGLTVLLVFTAALAPLFLSTPHPSTQAWQLLTRLFPFGRGLVHAYWAPNVWAFYCAKDLALGALSRRLNLSFHDPTRPAGSPTWTSGLVQVIEPEVLFPITPLFTALLTFGSMVPSLYSLWRRPTPTHFLYALFHTSLCAFMLGWHVHEKAILVPIILAALLAFSSSNKNPEYGRLFFWLSTIGHASLLPLFPPLTPDVLTALLLIHLHLFGAWYLLQQEGLLTSSSSSSPSSSSSSFSFTWPEVLYLLGLEAMLLFVSLIHPVWVAGRLPFLARLVSSLYSSVGLTCVWTQSYRLMALGRDGEEEEEEEEEEGGRKEARRSTRTTTTKKKTQ